MNNLARPGVNGFSVLVYGCILTVLLVLGGCSKVSEYFSMENTEGLDMALPAQNLAIKGLDDYNVGKYFTALEYFEEILDRYPFTPEATLAELKAADCHFHMERYEEAFSYYVAFEERHPTNEAIPYVMFQKAMCHYMQINRIDRSTSGAEESIKLFNQFLRAYPDTPYTEEAQERIVAAREFLAHHEYFVVEFYIRTKKYEQAEQRLNYLLTMYPESSLTEKAEALLARLEAGDPPKMRLRDWIPRPSLPDLSTLAR